MEKSQETLRFNFPISLEVRAQTEKLSCRKPRNLNSLSLWTEMNSHYIQNIHLEYCTCCDQIHHSLICRLLFLLYLKMGLSVFSTSPEVLCGSSLITDCDSIIPSADFHQRNMWYVRARVHN